MALFNDHERRLALALSRLSYCNPFLPERVAYEREILSDAFTETGAAWHKQQGDTAASPNLAGLTAHAQTLADAGRDRLRGGCATDDAELSLYETVVLYLLYYRTQPHLLGVFEASHGEAKAGGARVGLYDDFERDLRFYLALPGKDFPGLREPAHLFACFYQVRRAFHHIFEYIIGSSMAVARLRAAVWQSIFTHDMALYRRTLYRRMGEIATLITGPSGTGKELVARAIGLSRYLPFDTTPGTFATGSAAPFHPVSLSALSPTLIESELFGHRRGAFTGAVEDRAGWFEVCGPLGAVFLDEIGEVSPPIQVKLLRALDARTFQRIGETAVRRFEGKIVAATNRDPFTEMQAGRMRADFYYRLCSDVIVTPSLRERLEDAPAELRDLLEYIARIVVGHDGAGDIAAQVEAWVTEHLGPDYPWPGNVRELEQCVRNVLIHGAYHPPGRPEPNARGALADAVRAGRLSAADLLRHYCALVYADAGTYQEAARRLGLDHRTVKAKIDPALLARYAADTTRHLRNGVS